MSASQSGTSERKDAGNLGIHADLVGSADRHLQTPELVGSVQLPGVPHVGGTNGTPEGNNASSPVVAAVAASGGNQTAAASGGNQTADADGFVPVRSSARSRRSGEVRAGLSTGSKEDNRFSILQVEEEEVEAVAVEDGNSVSGSIAAEKNPTSSSKVPSSSRRGKGKMRDEEESSSWSKEVVRSALRELGTVQISQDRLLVTLVEGKDQDAMEEGEILASSSRCLDTKENLDPVVGLLEDQKAPDIEPENPFASHFRVIKDSEQNVGLGQEVMFKGEFTKKLRAGRGPKQKGVGRVSPSVAGDTYKAAEKRRALGSLDPNGCRLARRESSQDTEDEGRRERKLRDDGLSQIRQVREVIRLAEIGAEQELKVDNWATGRWLKALRRNGTVIFDRPHGSRGGTALVLDSSVQVLSSGVGANGRMAWARIKIGNQQLGVISIHAPNKRRSRIAFWQKVLEITSEGEWIVAGDYNQVELQEDSRGRSAVVRGREERKWRELALQRGLVDGFFCAASRTGVRFTRIVKRESRTDWSRLDRFYITSGAQWVDHVHEIQHHTACTLSDHAPILISIQVEAEGGRKRMDTYFKMCHHDLSDPVIKQRVEEAWHRETEVVRDARRKWARGWCRVKQVLREARSERERRKKEDGNLAAEIEWRRSQLTEDHTEEEAEALRRVEKRARDQALQEAREWRIRSRVRWLSHDDAPSKYFFTKLRAKWARDTISALETGDGETITDREEILHEVHDFYQQLYEAEAETDERKEAREELVGLVTNKLSPEESGQLSRLPEKLEIDSVVLGMKSNKAPGQDGLTIEVLKFRTCWFERNKVVYDQSWGYLPSNVILDKAKVQAMAARRGLRGDRGRRVQQRDEEFFAMAARKLALQTTRRRNMDRILQALEGVPVQNTVETLYTRSVDNSSSDSDMESLSEESSETSSDSSSGSSSNAEV
ncbi:hypothetical protein R1sor_000975 [Riccia sorocarpa]|uniref:Endonuclease/exonuclease/phosphatase domain-containing protein n=1 Tax=Riccia sorocarpa TaxID=122646 RepID=A0ABD3GUP3_9MARC